MKVTCDNCQWNGEETEVRPLNQCPDIWDRLDPGGEVPVGDCPKCQCFCYYDRQADDSRFSEDVLPDGVTAPAVLVFVKDRDPVAGTLEYLTIGHDGVWVHLKNC